MEMRARCAPKTRSVHASCYPCWQVPFTSPSISTFCCRFSTIIPILSRWINCYMKRPPNKLALCFHWSLTKAFWCLSCLEEQDSMAVMKADSIMRPMNIQIQRPRFGFWIDHKLAVKLWVNLIDVFEAQFSSLWWGYSILLVGYNKAMPLDNIISRAQHHARDTVITPPPQFWLLSLFQYFCICHIQIRYSIDVFLKWTT